MATIFAMPKLGLNMVEGRIVSWLAKEGEQVHAGQPILEIETDKATNEVEAPVDGRLAKIMHQEDEVVPCNGVLAILLAEGEQIPEHIPAMIGEDVAPKSEVMSMRESTSASERGMTGSATSEGRIIISPAAKKMAQELGVDITKVVPTGNQVRREDVEKAYEAMQAKPVPASAVSPAFVEEAIRKPYSGIRKLTGEHMAQSVHTTARVALSLDVNAEKLMARRKALESSAGKASYNLLLAQAAAKALKEFPYMNSRLVGEEIWEMTHVNIGIAVDTDRGLLVPVLKDADQKTIEMLQAEFNALTERALTGKANPQDLEGGTFTITNLGAQEIEVFIPVINLPECAILAVGALMPKAVVQDGNVVARNLMNLTLVFDHRLVDGYGASKFLQHLKHILEE